MGWSRAWSVRRVRRGRREVDDAKSPAYLFLQAIQLRLPSAVASTVVRSILETLRRPRWDRERTCIMERTRIMALVTVAAAEGAGAGTTR